MRTQGIKAGDIVRCDVRGQLFYASVLGNDDGTLSLSPLTGTFLPTYNVKARQVVGHYSKRKGSK